MQRISTYLAVFIALCIAVISKARACSVESECQRKKALLSCV